MSTVKLSDLLQKQHHLLMQIISNDKLFSSLDDDTCESFISNINAILNITRSIKYSNLDSDIKYPLSLCQRFNDYPSSPSEISLIEIRDGSEIVRETGSSHYYV